jgi:hypothetical protein
VNRYCRRITTKDTDLQFFWFLFCFCSYLTIFTISFLDFPWTKIPILLVVGVNENFFNVKILTSTGSKILQKGTSAVLMITTKQHVCMYIHGNTHTHQYTPETLK